MLQLKALTLHDLPRPSLAKNHQARTQLHLDRTRVKPNLAALILGLSLLSSVFIYLACEFWFLVKLEIAGFFLFLLQLEIIVFEDIDDNISMSERDREGKREITY